MCFLNALVRCGRGSSALALAFAVVGCGTNTPPGDSGGPEASASDAASADAGGDTGAVADVGGDTGPVADVTASDVPLPPPDAAVRGCAMPGGPMCQPGLMCCSGVPYPPEGSCNVNCDRDSDREIKTAFAPVDPSQVLARVARLPISEWSYLRDGPGVRHVGPTAQDFRRAFGLGSDDRHIHSIDADGVALAAIQALTRRVEALERENAALRARRRTRGQP